MDKNIPTVFIGADEELPEPTGIPSADRQPADGATEPDREIPGTDDNLRTTARPATPFATISPLDFRSAKPVEPRSGNSGTDSTKRRGRPVGSRNRTTTAEGQKAPLDLASNIEDLLQSLHFMVAKFMKIDELELSDDEARKLTRAVREVGKHYNFSVDPKKVAIGQLMMVAGGIYGPRAVAIYNQKVASPRPVTAPRPAPPASAAAPREPLVNIDTRKAPEKATGTGGPTQLVPSMFDTSPLVDGFEI